MANLPPDPIVEQALRDVVRDTFGRGDNENLTVKRMRTAAEDKLGLEHDFFRLNAEWKTRSKEVIEQEAKAQEDSTSASESDGDAKSPPDPNALESSPSTPPTNPKTRTPNVSRDNRKKRKFEEEPAEAPESKKIKSYAQRRGKEKKTTATQKRRKVGSGSDNSSEKEIRSSSPDESPTASIKHDSSLVDDDSDLSELVDDSPKPKPKKKRKDSAHDGGTAKAKPEKKTKAAKDKSQDDPDTERIKSLQGWLLKCGIRKVWGAYLKSYETPKDKIKHLESMLSDVGMTGRFSLEKASQIKERREMAADLEAVQEGDKKWGKADSEEEGGRPRKRLAKGFQALDFLGDDDGEETD